MSKATATATSLDFVTLAFNVGQSVGEVNGLENKAAALKDAANVNIKALHDGKVKIGQYRQNGTGCPIATAFVDGCVQANVAPTTAQRVYLVTFKAAVVSGKPVTDWNSNRAKNKSGGGRGKGKAEFADLLLKAFNHDGGATLQNLCVEIETRYADDKIRSVYDGFVYYFESEGYDITK